MSTPTWTPVDPSSGARTFTYSFGPGTANTLAIAGAGGGQLVVSPPCNPTDACFTELEKHGPVRTIVAPNAFHSMGLAPWKTRYPDVPIFAPAQSIARLEKTTKLTGIRPLVDAAAIAGDRVELIDMPHYKTGEVLVRWSTDGGTAWYMTDLAMNLTQRIPGLFGFIFRMTKSTPGFRRNALGTMFMVKDKHALFAWIAEQAAAKPPKLIAMCHGEHLRPDDPVADVRAAFA